MATVVTTGLRETAAAALRAAAALNEGARVIAGLQAAVIERNAKLNFVGSHKAGEPHVGGKYPNVVTGNLRRSIMSDAVRPSGDGWGTKVGPTAVYGRRVELGYSGGGGGRGHQTTRAFPFLAPAVELSQAQMAAVALSTWAKVFA